MYIYNVTRAKYNFLNNKNIIWPKNKNKNIRYSLVKFQDILLYLF